MSSEITEKLENLSLKETLNPLDYWNKPLQNLPKLTTQKVTGIPKYKPSTYDIIYKNDDRKANNLETSWKDILNKTETTDINNIYKGPNDMKVSIGKIIGSKLISNEKSRRKVIELKIKDLNDIEYLPGESIAIWTNNRDEIVEELFNILKLDKDKQVDKLILNNKNDECIDKSKDWIVKSKDIKLYDLIKYGINLNGFPKKKVLRSICEYCETDIDKQYPKAILGKESSSLYLNLQQRCTNLIQILKTFKVNKINIAELLEILEPLKPRYYTMLDTYETSKKNGYIRVAYTLIEGNINKENNDYYEGLCSNVLYRLSKSPKIFNEIRNIDSNDIKNMLPSALEKRQPMNQFGLTNELLKEVLYENKILILSCNGIGIAPFISILNSLEEHCLLNKEIQLQKQVNPLKVWLIHRIPSFENDSYYKEELNRFVELGILGRLTYSISSLKDSQESSISLNSHFFNSSIDCLSQPVDHLMTVFFDTLCEKSTESNQPKTETPSYDGVANASAQTEVSQTLTNVAKPYRVDDVRTKLCGNGLFVAGLRKICFSRAVSTTSSSG